MKKLLKLSLLVALFMAICTVISYAAESAVDYSEFESNNKITVTFTRAIDSQNFINNVTSAGWTLNAEKTQMTKTNTNKDPYFFYASNEKDGVIEEVKVATPFTIKNGKSITLNKGTVENPTPNSPVSVSPDKKTITGENTGSVTLVFNSTTDGGTAYSINWNITVTEDDTPAPTPEGATDFSGLKLSFRDTDVYTKVEADYSGVTKQKNHLYKFYVSKDAQGSATNESLYLDYFTQDKDGKDIIAFSTESSRLLAENTGDKYLHILEKYYENSEQKIKTTDIKISDSVNVVRPIGSRFDIFVPDKNKSTIINNIKASNDRKVTYQIGIVNSTEILKAFKDNPSNGFSKLLAYAKGNKSPLKTDTFEMPTNNQSALDYNILKGINIATDTYYYIYCTISTNDGTYVETEDVQIYRGIEAGTNGTAVHFAYGSINIPDEPNNPDGNNNPSDEEKSPVLPDTGEKTLIFSIIGVTAIVAIVLFKKNKITKIK